MSNGPKTHQEAVNIANTSKQTGGAADTRGWNHTAKQTYFSNGGK